MVLGKITINAYDIKKMTKKLKSISNRVKRTGQKSPKDAATYMVLQARRLAPFQTGIMRKNINAFRRGRNSYEVISHRFPRGNESPIKNFPVHAWIEGIVKVGGWGKRPYTGKGLGYFSKAARNTRHRFVKGVRRDIQRALRIKF